MNKAGAVTIALIVMVIVFFAGYYLRPTEADSSNSLELEEQINQLQNQINELNKEATASEDYQNCLIQEANKIPRYYVEGEIIVEFNDISREEAENLIKEQGLGYSSIFSGPDAWTDPLLKSILVKVPEGEELKWVCVFQQNSIVKSTSFSGMGPTT